MVEMGKMNKDCPLKKRVQNEKNKEETWKGMTEKKNEHNRDNYHESCVCKLCERNGCDISCNDMQTKNSVTCQVLCK